MVQIIDRRFNSKNKSTVNRQRFLRRYKAQIKKSLSDIINRRSITDLDTGDHIRIPAKDITEPSFQHAAGGIRERIYPGNKTFVKGDKFKRPSGDASGSQGSEASPQGEGMDDFVFQVSRDEYLELLFEDLELPNFAKNKLQKLLEYRQVRAGFSHQGTPSQINIIRSLKGALARRIGSTASLREKLRDLEQEHQRYTAIFGDRDPKTVALAEEIARLKQRIEKVPFIDSLDLRYNLYAKHSSPSSQAVMFCLMDVSGSMDQATKDMAKRFFILLYLFLHRSYKNVDVVFIRHHTQAKEVNEHDFFYSQETGGTIVSSALHLMDKIISQRYPPEQWNIYGAQASDGDNWSDDSPQCRQLLIEQIMPITRYFAYVEITKRNHQSLWQQYQHVAEACPHFAMQSIQTQADIYPIFHQLFKRQTL